MTAHIAVIDDDRETRELIQSALELEGYRASLLSGEGCVVSQLEALSPDLILLDVMIADIDGYELCKLIKQNQTLQNIPVVFVSGMPIRDAEHGPLAEGTNHYLSKPFLLDSLYRKIQTLLTVKA
jgi:CheY-like chemotaxis protein